MSDSTKVLSIARGIASGFNQASGNLVNIMEAKYRLKQNQELLDLKKKAIEKDDVLVPYQKEKLLSAIDANKAHVAYYTALSKAKEEDTQAKLKQTQDTWDKFNLAIDQFKQPDGSLVFGDGTSIAANEKGWRIAKARPYAATRSPAMPGQPKPPTEFEKFYMQNKKEEAEQRRKGPLAFLSNLLNPKDHAEPAAVTSTGLNELTQKAIGALDDYESEEEALAGLKQHKQYLAGVDQDQLLGAWEEKFGSSDNARSILEE